MEEDILQELQGNRPRSRTWPLPQPEELVEVEKTEEKTTAKLEAKKSSRKNAWGNLSYADLITQAITSSPDQRMTLSQIYTWMVDNIPYFKDKGDSTSSAGWKNSIRHNLSLHNRFSRIQNEGNGKSSWWIVDQEAKTEKTKRRARSASLDSDGNGPKTTKPRRGRKAKGKNIEEQSPQSPSTKARTTLPPKSPISGEPSVIIEDNPFPFPIVDYRNRSSSNTSNVSSLGRLSPIPSHDEEDKSEMALSPAQDRGDGTPVAMEELMDNLKESMSIGQGHAEVPTQFRNRCSNEEPMSLNSGMQSMNVDSPPTFIDRYTAPNYPKTIVQKNLVNEQNTAIHRNGVYLRGNANSPNHFMLPERSIGVAQFTNTSSLRQNARPAPPPYNHTLFMTTNCLAGRYQGNNNTFSPYTPMRNDSVPLINVEMADEQSVGTDIDFLELEGDIECDVENVLRDERAFDDGFLDFNFDNYVPAIALPEMPFQGYVSGNMVH